jgi:hypothetical protein
MAQLLASVKRFALCAMVIVLAQQASATVLILDGTASPTTAPPDITPAPPSAPPKNDPASIAQPDSSPLPVSGNTGALEPAATAAAATPASAWTSSETATTSSTAPAPNPPMVSSDLGAVKVANPAEVMVEMMPGQTVSVGSRVSFRITSQKAGYIVLIDVDATGHLTQIYPNTASLVRTTTKPNGNYIKAGGKLTIPLATDPYSGVEYVVSPPSGQAMIVAILSAQPVQILDLPDVLPEARNQSDALTYLAKWTSELRIPDDATSQLREARWSFNAKSYTIQ